MGEGFATNDGSARRKVPEHIVRSRRILATFAANDIGLPNRNVVVRQEPAG